MNKKTTPLTIATVTLAAILLTSGFGLSSAHAQLGKSSSTEIKLVTSSSLGNHSVIFQVCANDYAMRAPEVIITSDSQVKSVKLNKEIGANTCKVTSTTIKAFDKNSIQIKKVDKSKINLMIGDAEKRLTNIKSKISDKNTQLEEAYLTLQSANTSAKPASLKKINDVTSELVDLRRDLQDARAEYYRLLYVLRG